MIIEQNELRNSYPVYKLPIYSFRFISNFLLAKLRFFFHNAKIITHKEIFSYIFLR